MQVMVAMADNARAQAVCYRESDYAGLIRRILIICIDSVAIFAIWLIALTGTWSVWLALHPEGSQPPAVTLWLIPLTAYAYLTLLKRSRIGTLGYLLTGVRIVGIDGRRPSLLQMTARIMGALPSLVSVVMDLTWLSEEPARQTLRDKWAGTFVIKRKAKPIGWAPLRSKYIHIFGLSLIIREPDLPVASPATCSGAAAGAVE